VDEPNYATICAQVNAALEIRALVKFINWHPDRLIREGDVYLALCPIHREPLFRTLVLNPRSNTYHCKHVACAGHQPGDFLDLLARVGNSTLPEVLADLTEHFGADYFRLSKAQVSLIHDLVAQVRAERGR
jgi:hypothetical protein